MKLIVSTVTLESIAFDNTGQDIGPNHESAIDFVLTSDEVNPLVRLTATMDERAPYTLCVTYAARIYAQLEHGEQAPDDMPQRALVVAAPVLETYCRDAIAHLTLRGSRGAIVVGPLDVEELVNRSPDPLTVRAQVPVMSTHDSSPSARLNQQ